MTAGWKVDAGPWSYAHVRPVNDIREHDTSADCWCGPTLDDGVWVHHAADRREEHEKERRMQ